ncbi:Uncharacterised protein [uncultured Flavonifractor sp.]|nr:Uncharacterised protein [uncultured Flavonifractor sp.]
MNLKDVKIGIHTFELYAGNLKYHQIQKSIDYLMDQKSIQRRYSDPYSIDRHLKSKYLVDEGVRMRLYQSHNKSNGISFAVTPSTLLAGVYQPLELYRPTKENVAVLQSRIGDFMDELHLSDHGEPILAPGELSLSRMDLTADLHFNKSADISSLIRLFRKSMLPRHYKREELEGKQDHSFQLATKEISFKVYDKICELEQDNRCPEEHRKRKVLRLEVSMKREAFLEKLDLGRKDDLYTMLKAGYDHIRFAAPKGLIFRAFLRAFPGREYCNPSRPGLLPHFVTYHASGHVGPRFRKEVSLGDRTRLCHFENNHF